MSGTCAIINPRMIGDIIMSRTAERVAGDAMVRKPILMPKKLITEVEKMAQQASDQEKRNVSFAEMVRRALAQYNPNDIEENDAVMNALLDNIIKSTKETKQTVRKLNKRLDKSYKELMNGNN